MTPMELIFWALCTKISMPDSELEYPLQKQLCQIRPITGALSEPYAWSKIRKKNSVADWDSAHVFWSKHNVMSSRQRQLDRKS
jgi:hypothetical protein